MKTIILGAGASFGSDHKLPVISKFFDKSLVDDETARSAYQTAKFEWLREFIKKEFQLWKDTRGPEAFEVYLPKLNVEEIFVHLEGMLDSTPPHLPLYGELLIARSQLLFYISKRLKFREATEPCTKYEKLLDFINTHSDSILSFNWDVLLDRVLFVAQHGTIAFHYRTQQNKLFTPLIEKGHPSPQKPSLACYLKMHGSLHWYVCSNESCPAHGLIMRDQLSEGQAPIEYDIIRKVQDRLLCANCGRDLDQAMVPPIAGKFSHMVASIRAQWTMALEVLRESNEWIIIGYSLPDLDVEAKSLFRSAGRSSYASLSGDGGSYPGRTIHIADPNADEIEQKLNALIPRYLTPIKKYQDFDAFLEEYGD